MHILTRLYTLPDEWVHHEELFLLLAISGRPGQLLDSEPAVGGYLAPVPREEDGFARDLVYHVQPYSPLAAHLRSHVVSARLARANMWLNARSLY